MTSNELTSKIIGAAIEVHKTLGPGLSEDCYKYALLHELSLQGLNAAAEVPVPVTYKGVTLASNKFVDILVENEIVVELKSVLEMKDVFHKQILTYMRLLNKKYGLLINFNEEKLINGVYRKINGY